MIRIVEKWKHCLAKSRANSVNPRHYNVLGEYSLTPNECNDSSDQEQMVS